MTWLRRALPVSLFLYSLSVLTTMAGMELFGWLSFLLSAAVFFVDRKSASNRWPKPVLESSDKALLALLAVIVLSALFTESPQADLTFIIGNGRFVLLFIMLRLGLESLPTERLANGLKILLPIAGVIGLYAIWQHFSGVDLIRGLRNPVSKTFSGDTFVYRSQGMWGHPVTFGHSMALTFCIPFAIALVGVREKTWVRRAAIGVALSCGTALMFSYTRGAWIGLAAACFVMSLYLGRRIALSVVGALLVGVTALSVGSSQFRGRLESIVSPTNQSNLERIDVWTANIAMFKDHPILGVGYGVNEDMITEYYEKLGIKQEFGGHAHNNYLQFLSGTGLLGFLCYAAFTVFALLMAHRLLRSLPAGAGWPRALALGAMGAQVALHVGGLTECNFKDAEVNHQFMLILAVLTVIYRQNRGTAIAPTSTR